LAGRPLCFTNEREEEKPPASRTEEGKEEECTAKSKKSKKEDHLGPHEQRRIRRLARTFRLKSCPYHTLFCKKRQREAPKTGVLEQPPLLKWLWAHPKSFQAGLKQTQADAA
jgi:hypothetical protein